jgi:hypothetical protein
MARTPTEHAAVQRSKALLETEVSRNGGGASFRVAVRHTDPDHDSSATFHWGPAFDSNMSAVIAHVKGVAPGEVDLLEEAKTAAARAAEEYPESDGWEVSIEAIVPHPDNVGDENDRHLARRVEGG